MNETFQVAAIKHGTVIDHINPGKSLNIVQVLSLHKIKYKMTIGINLPSIRMGNKDLLKIENWFATDIEAGKVILFSPLATINLIKNYQVQKKLQVILPEEIKSIFICPNTMCVTNHAAICSYFHIYDQGKKVMLTCHYCQKSFDRDHMLINLIALNAPRS